MQVHACYVVLRRWMRRFRAWLAGQMGPALCINKTTLTEEAAMSDLSVPNRKRASFVDGLLRGAAAPVDVYKTPMIGYPHASMNDALMTDVKRIRKDVERAKESLTREAGRPRSK